MENLVAIGVALLVVGFIAWKIVAKKKTTKNAGGGSTSPGGSGRTEEN